MCCNLDRFEGVNAKNKEEIQLAAIPDFAASLAVIYALSYSRDRTNIEAECVCEKSFTANSLTGLIATGCAHCKGRTRLKDSAVSLRGTIPVQPAWSLAWSKEEDETQSRAEDGTLVKVENE